MPTTSFFDHFTVRQKELSKVFLPVRKSPIGAYSDKAYEKASAYTLLVHAEIEYYFEEVALSIAKAAIQNWDVNHVASRTLVAMVAYNEKQFQPVPEYTNDKNKINEDLEFRIKDSYKAYNEYVRARNHGIKEKNVLAIFLPLGLTINDFDNNVLIALNNLGSSRGNIAHSTKAKQQISPPDAKATVKAMEGYLAVFDEMLYNEYNAR